MLEKAKSTKSQYFQFQLLLVKSKSASGVKHSRSAPLRKFHFTIQKTFAGIRRRPPMRLRSSCPKAHL